MIRITPKPPQALAPTDARMTAKDAKLLKAAQQMEGSFVEQMYKTMRETVPTDGMFNGGSGEEMFTSMMDQRVAADTPTKWQHGLSESIFRQMRNAVHAQSAAAASSESAASSPSMAIMAASK